jgi:hypothetical protein
MERRAALALGECHHPCEQLLAIALRAYGSPRDEVLHREIPSPGEGFGNPKAHDRLDGCSLCHVRQTLAILLLLSDLRNNLLLHEMRT